MLAKISSKKPVVMTSSIFGEQVHCLLKDGEYFVSVEELHSLFFRHIRLSLFLRIFKRLVQNSDDLPLQQMTSLLSVLGRVHCSKVIRFSEAKHLLVKIKAILTTVKSKKLEKSSQEHHGFHCSLEQVNQHGLQAGNNTNGVVLYYLIPPVTTGTVVNLIPVPQSVTHISASENVAKSTTSLSHNTMEAKKSEVKKTSEEDIRMAVCRPQLRSKGLRAIQYVPQQTHANDLGSEADHVNEMAKSKFSKQVKDDKPISDCGSAVTNLQQPKTEQKRKRLSDIVGNIAKKKRKISST